MPIFALNVNDELLWNKESYLIGVQNFEKLRRDGYVYVDKTAIVHRLVTTGSYYFLSRPRHFGKSLLISTLEAYYQSGYLTIKNYDSEFKLYKLGYPNQEVKEGLLIQSDESSSKSA